MTVVHEGANRIYMGARAVLIDGPDHETASEWAASHMVKNPAYSWILGKFVEADVPNLNKQVFNVAGLQMGQPSILYAPMNINHHIHRVVGCYSGAELLYPTEEQAAQTNPYIETVGALWRYYYKDEYYMVKAAHDEGKLFYSMECVPTAFSTVGGKDDTKEYAYEGRTSVNYPAEINERIVPVLCHNPHFVGGALVIPPETPAWTKAEVRQMSSFFKENWQEAERAFETLQEEAPHLDEDVLTWVAAQMAVEYVTERNPELGREFTAQNRRKLAETGAAMEDGSFPIVNLGDLKNAIQAIGRAKDPEAAKRHIKKRAKKLGAADMIPTGW